MNNTSRIPKSFFTNIIMVIISAIISERTQISIGETFLVISLILSLIIGPILLLSFKLLFKEPSWEQMSFQLLLAIFIILMNCGISGFISKLFGNIDFFVIYIIITFATDLLIHNINLRLKDEKNADS